MRKLASIKRITSVADIPGKDRIGLAVVDGWTVIVQKSEFSPGDLCVYVEIDSVLPERPEFEFLRSKDFRIKTMKMSGAISQGICFPLSILPDGDYKENDDVTEIVGVKKWERKDATDVDEKQINNQRMKKYPKWLMRFRWFRQLIYHFDHRGSKAFPDFISKTDETRIQNAPFYLDMDAKWTLTEKIDGCLTGDACVTTDEGVIPIRKIVNQKLPVNVLSYNEELNICEFKKIIDYHKIPANRQRYKIGVAYQGKGNRPKYIECTDNHKFLTQRGWVRADELEDCDLLMHFSNKYDAVMNEVLTGCLLGDSSLNANSETGAYRTVLFNHSEKQEDYFNYKKNLFGEWFIQENDRISGYGSRILCGKLVSNLTTWRFLNTYFPNNGKKIITKEFADQITPISLAFWFMDDGNIKNRDEPNLQCRSMLNTQGFTLEEVEILQEALYRKFNISSAIGEAETYNGNILSFNVENTEKLASLIAPYVCTSMKYKLPQKYEKIPCVFENYTIGKYEGIVHTDIISIEKVDMESNKKEYVFDLEVEDNHNYFAKNILVHNCSGSFAIVKHKSKLPFKKALYEYIVCSRNLRLYNKDNSSYWSVSDRYNLEFVLRQMLDKTNFDWVAIQGECIAPGVQGNKYKVTEPDLYVFNLIYPTGRIGSVAGRDIVEQYGLKWVPIVNEETELPKTVPEMLELAHGESALGNTIREGLVCRTPDGRQSFKAVDPEFLIKYNE